jgi:MinD-like ATPase involved in chromosome partitioning or flagellar assembly
VAISEKAWVATANESDEQRQRRESEGLLDEQEHGTDDRPEQAHAQHGPEEPRTETPNEEPGSSPNVTDAEHERETTGEQPASEPAPAVASPPSNGPQSPLVSEDGRWWWDGTQWRPMPAPGVANANANGMPRPGAAAQELDEAFRAESFLRHPAAAAPPRGARKLLFQLSRGAINVGPSSRQQHEHQLLELARTPVKDPPTRLAFVSSKGGVGKTTTCLLTSSQLGLVRHDRIIALEANPHHGTFRSRVQMHHDRSVQHLLNDLEELGDDEHVSYPLLHRYTTQADENRLEVLTIPLDPAISRALGEDEYKRVLRILYRFYDVVALDLGTGLLEPSTAYMLRICDQAVVVSPAALDGGKLADYTLDYIEARRGREWLRERAVVVINGVRRDTLLEVSAMERHFRRRVRSCHRIRWDRHLEAGGVFDWAEVRSGAREDYLELAAAVGSGFSMGQAPDSLGDDERC